MVLGGGGMVLGGGGMVLGRDGMTVGMDMACSWGSGPEVPMWAGSRGPMERAGPCLPGTLPSTWLGN